MIFFPSGCSWCWCCSLLQRRRSPSNVALLHGNRVIVRTRMYDDKKSKTQSFSFTPRCAKCMITIIFDVRHTRISARYYPGTASTQTYGKNETKTVHTIPCTHHGIEMEGRRERNGLPLSARSKNKRKKSKWLWSQCNHFNTSWKLQRKQINFSRNRMTRQARASSEFFGPPFEVCVCSKF